MLNSIVLFLESYNFMELYKSEQRIGDAVRKQQEVLQKEEKIKEKLFQKLRRK